MFIISVRTNFAAAHRLIGYQGECSRLHGHNWSIKISVSTHELDAVGIGYDFRNLKKDIQAIIMKYDHQLLNEIAPFDQINPTSENLAKLLFQSLKKQLPPHINMLSVEISESDNYAVTYVENNN